MYELLWKTNITKSEHGVTYLDPELSINDSSTGIIMVRAEYEELWEVINRARLNSGRLGASRGMAIVGHRGIGSALLHDCEAFPLTGIIRQILFPPVRLRKGVTVRHPGCVL